MRNFIFYASVSYMIVVLSLIGVNYFGRTTEINFGAYKDYENQIKILENRVSNYPDNECTNSIKKLINISKDTYFVGNTKVTTIYDKLYNDDMPWLSLYNNTIKDCKLDTNKSSKDAVTALLYSQELINEYTFDYVVVFPDLEYADSYKGTLISMENTLRKDAEIRTINSIMNEVD